MAKNLLALVYMHDSEDNFFLERCPEGPPESWIGNHVYDIAQVESVEVYELAAFASVWVNPNPLAED